jgi:tetratricopeptide (TPR) repeat protein
MMSGTFPTGVSEMLHRGIAASERGEYAAALQLLEAVYKLTSPEKMPLGLSSYGLCIAHVQRKQKMGLQLCHQAMELQSEEGMHWANLVRLYIVGKNRRKAVETLHSGLEKFGDNAALIRVRQEIGYRQTPSLGFLPRRHPLNRFFSKTAGRLWTLIRPRPRV